MKKKNEILKFREPRLKFGYGQDVEDPRDGLTLFGPYDRGKLTDFSVGIIGTPEGRRRMKNWLKKINGPIYYPTVDIAKPFFPGYEATFGVTFPFEGIVELDIHELSLNQLLKYSDAHQRVSNVVDMYVDELVRYRKEEESKVDLWFVVIPDDVYQYCRPMSKIPKEGSIKVGISDKYSRHNPGLFDDEETIKMKEAYYYENHFHNQLKLKLLKHGILTQIIRESTVAYKEFTKANGLPKRDLANFETAIAWNVATAIYYKIGGLPWKLADVRDGVCYIGLVFKNDETQVDRRIACCAAQMFLDSGDGLVFKGAVGPWYNPDNKEYHLTYESAKELIAMAVDGFQRKNGIKPKEIFIHGKTNFSDEEWEGFSAGVGTDIKLVGVRITQEKEFKLFRDGDFPVMRNSAYIKGRHVAYLWTKGFIPRLQSVLGLETPNPLCVRVTRGEANITSVCKDILALTKLNYNTCIFCDGTPVTLKFADAIGEILTAGPNEDLEVLPFKYYI